MYNQRSIRKGVRVILSGRRLARKVLAETKTEVDEFLRLGVIPKLAVVLVGEDPASQIYVRNKTRDCKKAGIEVVDIRLPEDVSESTVIRVLSQLETDPSIHGILVQLPLPVHINAKNILEKVPPLKDVDGFHPENAGLLYTGNPRFLPCTPAGIMRLIEESDTDLKGKEVCIIGCSNIVGKPLASLLLFEGATVTSCHILTRSIEKHIRDAEIVISAAGVPNLVKGDWIQQDAVVIDVGINRLANGKIIGDIVFEDAKHRAKAITPVPGGVGPMTIAMLAVNTVHALKILLGELD